MQEFLQKNGRAYVIAITENRKWNNTKYEWI